MQVCMFVSVTVNTGSIEDSSNVAIGFTSFVIAVEELA